MTDGSFGSIVEIPRPRQHADHEHTDLPWQRLVVSLAGWLNRQQQAVVEYLRTENQVLRGKLGRKRILLNDEKLLRNAVRQYLVHYHAERNHQGLCNTIIRPDAGVG